MPEEFNAPEIDVEGTIRAAGDSDDLVRALVEAGEHSEEVHNTIERNTAHLRLILSKEEIQASNSPRLVSFAEAIELGTTFVAEAAE